MRQVTLLGGDGGTGKSLLALQLAIASATNNRLLGRETREGSTIFISAEDDEEELHIRAAEIANHYKVSLADARGVTIRSLAGESALLAVEAQLGLTETTLFSELEQRAADDAPDLIVIDTAADTYPANENDRAKVRQFIGILRGLAIRRNAAVVLLAHPSLSGMTSGAGTSGSTAWNNSVRSRLYFSRVKDETGFDSDPNKRILVNKKLNYGQVGTEIGMTWRDGVFVADYGEPGLDRVARSAKAERVFLKLLTTFNQGDRHVSPNQSATHAPTVFAKHPDVEGVSKRALAMAMENLLSSGRVRIAEHGRGASIRKHLEVSE